MSGSEPPPRLPPYECVSIRVPLLVTLTNARRSQCRRTPSGDPPRSAAALAAASVESAVTRGQHTRSDPIVTVVLLLYSGGFGWLGVPDESTAGTPNTTHSPTWSWQLRPSHTRMLPTHLRRRSGFPPVSAASRPIVSDPTADPGPSASRSPPRPAPGLTPGESRQFVRDSRSFIQATAVGRDADGIRLGSAANGSTRVRDPSHTQRPG